MDLALTDQTPQTATTSATPLRSKTTRQLVDEALRGLPAAPVDHTVIHSAPKSREGKCRR
ncbi:hypothetical protein [Streptomyces angustmyceticus]|uniref:hypothetical protein n=1 Tax=Streptomyces angustmyceticus TaxID=285578 RepID=UPI0034500E03